MVRALREWARMIGTPTLGRPAITQPTGRKPALSGRWATPLFLLLSAAAISVPFLIVEEPADAGGRRGSPGTILLSETAPTVPGKLDLVLLVDASASYKDDLPNMARLVPNALRRVGAESNFRVGLASFIDDTDEDVPFTLERPLSPDTSGLGSAISGLDIGDGVDWPEMSLSALDRALDVFDFRDDAQVVVLITTDADSKEPRGHSPEQVGASYAERGFRIVPIFATQFRRGEAFPTFEQQGRVLANLTGGSVQELSTTDSSDIDAAILAGLQNLPVSMTTRLRPGCPVDNVVVTPDRLPAAMGGQSYEFELSYRITEDAPEGTSVCTIDLGGDNDRQFELRVES